MKFTQNDRMVVVTLSRRNLLSLLAKLYQENSSRTLQIPTDDGRILSVEAENDEISYAARIPGPVSHETQVLLDVLEQAADQLREDKSEAPTTELRIVT